MLTLRALLSLTVLLAGPARAGRDAATPANSGKKAGRDAVAAPNPDKKARDYWASAPLLVGHSVGQPLAAPTVKVTCDAGEHNLGQDHWSSVAIEVAPSNGSEATGPWSGPSAGAVCSAGPQSNPAKTCPVQMPTTGWWLVRCRIDALPGTVETAPDDNIRTIRVQRVALR